MTKSDAGTHLYLDGQDVTSTATRNLTVASSTGQLVLGGGAGPFNGSMADVAVYGYPLNPEQVRDHYRAVNAG